MRLRMTITGCPRPEAVHEVEVEAASGATAAELRHALRDLLQASPKARLATGRLPVDDGALLGHPPLLDGVALAFAVPAAAGASPQRPSQGAGTPRSVRHVPRSVVVLAVVGGPDAGRTFELMPGRLTMGRSPAADLTVCDPGLSRVHAALDVGPDGILVADLGSTNGTLLNGTPLAREPVPFTAADLLVLGASRLRLRAPTHQPPATAPTGEGTRTVNRRPRMLDDPAPVAIALPPPPERPPRGRVPWLAMVLPLPVSAAMAFFFGPVMLAFALLGPIMMAGNAIGDRVGARRAYAARLREHEAHRADVLARVEAALAQERRRRLRDLPDPAEVLVTATAPTSRVWERRRGDADFLTVTVGFCSDTAQTRLIRPPGDDGAEHPVVRDVPCRLHLGEAGVLGLSGPRERTLGVARSLVGQVAAFHSPLDVQLWLLTDGRTATSEWTWLSRLPHAWSGSGGERTYRAACLDGGTADVAAAVDQLRREVATRREAMRHPGLWSGQRVVVLLDGASALRAVPGLAELMAQGPSVGIVVVALAEAVESLPTEAVASLELGDARGRLRLSGSEHTDLVVDQVGAWWADRLSRGLAPLRDATPSEPAGEIPATAALLDILPFDATQAGDIADHWASSPTATRIPVGAGPRGAHHLDLARDGPHVLVGGTTGSGKSELLRTLVASLAVSNRPDQLSLVLIDYKGGSAFRGCAQLPHVAGLVTDLDGHLADRALVSLTAELKRREHLLAAAGVSDLHSYAVSTDAGSAPLPRLVIVIDEFRALAEELPRFVEGLVRIAALGRSLGVHLVLATQRPAGVVTADIKANVNLRIALRVRDRADSEDVIDAPDAAALSEQNPGRAYARSGGGPLLAFQGASVSGPATVVADTAVRVTRCAWMAGLHQADVAPASSAVPATIDSTVASVSAPPTQLSRIVDAVRHASSSCGVPAAPAAWPPPLPDAVDAASLAREHRLAPGEPRLSIGERWLVPLGLADRPEQQVQEPLLWDLRAPGHWGFAGASATGRSSALRTIAGHLASALGPTEVHLYAVGLGNLGPLAMLPHTGAAVDGADVARIERLVSRLTDDVSRRRAELARRHYSSTAEWLGADPTTAPPLMVLLVDDWEQLAGRLDTSDHGVLTDRLLSLLRDGTSAGLRVAIAGGRGVLTGRVSTHLSHKALLRPSDPMDATLVGLPASVLPHHQPPGRAILADGTEAQLAVHGDGSVAAWASWLAARPARTRDVDMPSARRPLRVDALPVTIRRSELPSVPPGSLALGVGVGVGVGELSPAVLKPERDGRQILIAGPPRGGKSTALLALAEALLAAGHPTAVVTSRPGPLDVLREGGRLAAWCRPGKPAPLIAARSQHPALAVLVDDAERVLDSVGDSLLREIAELVDRDHGLIVCAASAQHVAAQFRGVAAEVARRQTGLLLGPCGWGDGDVFGIRARPDPQAPPGRGLWVSGGVTLAVQVAQPDAAV